MQQAILVLTNTPDVLIAQTIAHQLIERKLAACVNILPGIQSVYCWQDKIESVGEVTLHIKTVRARYAEVEATIKALHSYDVPEIIALPIIDGLFSYLNWIVEETKRDINA